MKSKITIACALIALYSNGVAQTKTGDQESKTRIFQASVAPGFGTSRGAKEGYTNNLSLNIFAGYEHSLNGFELGAFYNGDKYNIKGAQLAGFANTVGGSVTGMQLAGFINTVKFKVTGVQGAGFVNITTSDINGGQFSGFANTSKNIKGTQITGFGNIVTGNVVGAQVAGLGNVTVKAVVGTQVAGLFNFSQDLKGAQVSGLVNKAKNVNGVQIGLINIADSIENGIVLGLVNIIKTGKHQFAIEHTDVMDLNVAFRSGTNTLYTVLFAGMEAKEDYLWSYGLGLGTQLSFNDKWHSSIELTTQSINPKEGHHENLNLLNRLNLSIGYQLANHLAISAGPALNIYVTDQYNQELDTYGYPIDNGTFYDETENGTNIKMWVGYNLSIKF